MIVFPFAKINLGLHVLRRRNDGYHDIESVLAPIPLYDALEAVALPQPGADALEFTRSGLPVPGPPDEDICLKAVTLIKELRQVPGLRMHLHKSIPVGAGLGGGSSDATHVLLLLNDLFRLELTAHELHGMAAELGSDCPFFLRPTPQLIEGRGERSRPVDLAFEGHWLLLVHPGIHVSTAEVYRNVRPVVRHMELPRSLAGPITGWPSSVANDLESHVFGKHPEIAAIKQQLLDGGAAYAAMSGSGSSVFGLFRKRPRLEFPRGYSTWALPL